MLGEGERGRQDCDYSGESDGASDTGVFGVDDFAGDVGSGVVSAVEREVGHFVGESAVVGHWEEGEFL